MDPIPDVPIDPSILSRDPEVGAAYAADPLVYHGPFEAGNPDRPLLEASPRCPRTTRSASCRRSGSTGPRTPWPRSSRPGRRSSTSGRSDFDQRIYEGAAHEVFNETNREEVLDDVVAFIHRALV